MPRYNLTTQKTWDATLSDLGETFRKWPDVTHWIVDPTRPRRAINQYHSPDERRVTLRYTKGGHEVVLTMAEQDRAHDNLRVLYLAVEAMRLNELRGISDVVASAYAQLPPPKDLQPASTPAIADPYQVLGLRRGVPLDVAEAVFRTLAKTAHPDAGGDRSQWDRVQAAIEQIRKEHQ